MRTRRVVALGLFITAVALAAVAVVGALWVGLDRAAVLSTYLLTNTAIGLSAAPCGLLIARARPRNPIGWLFLVLAIAPLLTAAAAPFLDPGPAAGWPEWSNRLISTVFMFSWPWGVFVALPIVLQLFPTGRPVSPAWRLGIWFTLATGVLGAYGTGPDPEMGGSPYLVFPGHEVIESLLPLTVVVWPVSIASLVVRYRRGDEVTRRSVLWLLLAVLVALGLNLPWAFSDHVGGEILLLLAFPLIPIASTIAVLRLHLFDVRLVVSRVLLYELLTVGAVTVYLGLVALLERALRGTGTPVLATVAVALLFNPARTRLQRAIDSVMYGAGRDPARAVTELGPRLAGTDLESILDGLREALRLPYAVIDIDGHRVTSGHPTDGQVLHGIPLLHGAEAIGQLEVAARWGERRLPAPDRALLDVLGPPLAVAARATLLAEELRASRERLVRATEEERRRLHRELHDSLGPVLTGAALTADSAALAAPTDAARAERLASELAGQLRQAIVEVRRIVYGLRPPVLDQLGLVGALRQHQGWLGQLELTVDAPQALPPLPAAVEVAAYRIATEAVTNVVRHAHAHHTVISLRANGGRLDLSVSDDGASSTGWIPGVGLASIRERATEVGGQCEVGPTRNGGRVAVALPLGES